MYRQVYTRESRCQFVDRIPGSRCNLLESAAAIGDGSPLLRIGISPSQKPCAVCARSGARRVQILSRTPASEFSTRSREQVRLLNRLNFSDHFDYLVSGGAMDDHLEPINRRSQPATSPTRHSPCDPSGRTDPLARNNVQPEFLSGLADTIIEAEERQSHDRCAGHQH